MELNLVLQQINREDQKTCNRNNNCFMITFYTGVSRFLNSV